MTPNTGDGFWRWLWQSYHEESDAVAEKVVRWFEARWYRLALVAGLEAIIIAGLWKAGAL